MTPLQRLTLNLEADLHAAGWDAPWRLYTVCGHPDDPRLRLTLTGADAAEGEGPCHRLARLGVAPPSAQGLVLATEGWALEETVLRAEAQTWAARLRAAGVAEERLSAAAANIIARRYGRPGAVAEHPHRVEVRGLTALARTGEEITLVRYRGRPPQLPPPQVRNAGRLISQLRRLLGQPPRR